MLFTSWKRIFFSTESFQPLVYTKFPLSNPTRGQKSFAAIMAEALDKFKQSKIEEKAAAKELLNLKEIRGKLKRRKWENYKADEAAGDDSGSKRANFDPATRVKRRKTAVLLSYSGANYFGMQRNKCMPTIEEELFKAMLKHEWITQDGYEQAQIASFQRAARTDKGVSAARQVCSVKLPDQLDIEALNADLPEQIRVFATQRVTKGFNSKDQCNARTYTYTLPTVAFANCSQQHSVSDYRIDSDTLKQVSDILKQYEGTLNFHNFTSRKSFQDPSAKRYIMSFCCSEPFVSPQGIEFVTLRVKGQSFMLHQIRKMVGLAIAIVRGNTTNATMERAFTEERLDLPMAPGLGLVLDTVHYERYNARYGEDGIHKPLTWVEQEEQIKAFVEKYINANIYKTEHEEQSMLNWLETLSRHSYDARKEEKIIDSKDDDNEE